MSIFNNEVHNIQIILTIFYYTMGHTSLRIPVLHLPGRGVALYPRLWLPLSRLDGDSPQLQPHLWIDVGDVTYRTRHTVV